MSHDSNNAASHRIVSERDYRKAKSYAVFISAHAKHMNEAHEALDQCGIPRNAENGNVLTLAQRFVIVRQRYSEMFAVYRYAKKHMEAMLEKLPNDLLRKSIETSRF